MYRFVTDKTIEVSERGWRAAGRVMLGLIDQSIDTEDQLRLANKQLENYRQEVRDLKMRLNIAIGIADIKPIGIDTRGTNLYE